MLGVVSALCAVASCAFVFALMLSAVAFGCGLWASWFGADAFGSCHCCHRLCCCYPRQLSMVLTRAALLDRIPVAAPGPLVGLCVGGSSRNRTCRGPVYSQPCLLDSSTAEAPFQLGRGHTSAPFGRTGLCRGPVCAVPTLRLGLQVWAGLSVP